MSNKNAALSRELKTVKVILSEGAPAARTEWQNAFKAYRDELEGFCKDLPTELSDAVSYVSHRELALTLRGLLEQFRAEPRISRVLLSKR